MQTSASMPLDFFPRHERNNQHRNQPQIGRTERIQGKMGLLQGSPAHSGRRGGPAAERKQVLAHQEIGVFVGTQLPCFGYAPCCYQARGRRVTLIQNVRGFINEISGFIDPPVKTPFNDFNDLEEAFYRWVLSVFYNRVEIAIRASHRYRRRAYSVAAPQ